MRSLREPAEAPVLECVGRYCQLRQGERFSQPHLAFDHTRYQAGCDQLDRLKDYFLACVLAVFPVSTYLHAGREDCLLNNFEDAIMATGLLSF